MRSLLLAPGPLHILCLGAHADDVEIGCGGAVSRLLAEHGGSSLRWVVLSAPGEREREARASAERLTAGARASVIDTLQFRDGHFPVALSAIKDALDGIKRVFTPDLVFTHCREDLHQDHRVVSDVAWQTFRGTLILEYEIPKWDGDLGRPNVYLPLSREAARHKAEHLLAAFPTQRSKPWFTEDTFLGLMRLRGVECGAEEGYAEAFYGRKVVLQPDPVNGP